MKLAEKITQANLEEAADQELQQELALWEVTLMDGLDSNDEDEA